MVGVHVNFYLFQKVDSINCKLTSYLLTVLFFISTAVCKKTKSFYENRGGRILAHEANEARITLNGLAHCRMHMNLKQI